MKHDNKKAVILVIITGVLAWTLGAAFDALYFRDETFKGLFALNVPVHDVVFGILFILGLAGFGLLYARAPAGRRVAREELRKHLAAVEASMDGVAIYDRDGKYLFVNEAYARINGYDRPLDVVGKTFRLVYDQTQIQRMEETIAPALKESGRWRGELVAHRKDGSAYDQEASVTLLEDGGRVCVIRDITERKCREEALRRSERFLNTIFDSIRDPFCIFDRDYRIVRANEAYAQLKNRTVDELVTRTCYKVLQGRDSVCDGCVIQKSFHSTDPCAKEKMIRLADVGTAWVEIYTYPILDESGRVTHVIEYTRDVTDRRKSEEEKRRLIERLEYLSKIDGLTGLLNRRALNEQLTYEIERSRRYRADLSVILCDLDNLKEINDTYGHVGGDTALQIVSAILRNSLRNVDISGRYGGDEFLVIVPQTPLPGAVSLAEKIRSAAQNTEVKITGDKIVKISLSIGVAGLGPPPEDTDELVKRVDAALYASKHDGRNRVTVTP